MSLSFFIGHIELVHGLYLFLLFLFVVKKNTQMCTIKYCLMHLKCTVYFSGGLGLLTAVMTSCKERIDGRIVAPLLASVRIILDLTRIPVFIHKL
jgi:hypothetical protein